MPNAEDKARLTAANSLAKRGRWTARIPPDYFTGGLINQLMPDTLRNAAEHVTVQPRVSCDAKAVVEQLSAARLGSALSWRSPEEQ